MCGRFNLRLTRGELQLFFDLCRAPELSPRNNIFPTQPIVAIRFGEAPAEQGNRVADLLRWGLVPSWSKSLRGGPVLINARSETVATTNVFRTAFKRRRCLIPASGFYEWQQVAPKIKQPWQISRQDGEPLAFAGVWERWESPEGSVLESCSILTTTANSVIRIIHDRMPVILPPAAIDEWLDPQQQDVNALQRWLRPCPEESLKTERVNAVED